jgi:soluble cytochrome b562
MSNTANININLNSKGAEKSLRELNAEAKKTNATFASVDKTFDEVYGGIRPLTNRLGEAEDRLYELSLAGKRGTAEFKALLNEAARLRTQMIQTDMVVDAMASTLTTKLLAGAGGVAGTFAIAQGALVTFGAESEELTVALTKLAGIMSALQGLRELRESLPVLQGLLAGAGAQLNSLGDATRSAASANTSYVETAAEVVSMSSDLVTANKVYNLAQKESADVIAKTTAELVNQEAAISKMDDAFEKFQAIGDIDLSESNRKFSEIQQNLDTLAEDRRNITENEFASRLNAIEDAAEVIEAERIQASIKNAEEYANSVIEVSKSFEDNAEAVEVTAKAQQHLNSIKSIGIELDDAQIIRDKALTAIGEERLALDNNTNLSLKELEDRKSNLLKLENSIREEAQGEIDRLRSTIDNEYKLFDVQSARLTQIKDDSHTKAIAKLTQHYQINSQAVLDNAANAKKAAIEQFDAMSKAADSLKDNSKYAKEAALATDQVSKAREALVEISQSELKLQGLIKEFDAANLAKDKEKIALLGEEISKHNINIATKRKEIVLSDAVTAATNRQAAASKGLLLANAPLIAVSIAAAAAIGALIYVYYKYTKAQEEAAKEEEKRKKVLEAQNKALKEQTDAIASESYELVNLLVQLKQTNKGSAERLELIKDINRQYGTTLKNLSDENEFQSQVNNTVREYITLKENEYRLSLVEDKFKKVLSEKLKAQAELNRYQKENNDLLEGARLRSTEEFEAFVNTEKIRRLYETSGDRIFANTLTQIRVKIDAYEREDKKLQDLVKRQGYLEESTNALTNGGKKYVKQTKESTDAQDKITIAFEQSTKAWEAYQEALNADTQKPLELTQYENELIKLTNGLKSLEDKRLSAYDEEKRNLKGLYKDKQITEDQYNAKLLESTLKFENEKLIVEKVWADKRAEFDKNWTEEQLLISKRSLAEKSKIELQAELDSLNAQRDIQVRDIDATRQTAINKERARLEVLGDYLSKSINLVEKRTQAELDLLEIQYEQDISNINLNSEEKLKLLAKFEADKKAIINGSAVIIADAEREITQITKTEFEIRAEQLQDFRDQYEELAQSLDTALSDAINGDLDEIGSSFKNLLDEVLAIDLQRFVDDFKTQWEALDLKGKISEVTQIAEQAAVMATNALSALYERQAEEQEVIIQERYRTEDRQLEESLENRLISQEEYDATVKRNEYTRETEERQARRESFEQQKDLAMTNAIVGISSSIIQALASAPPPFSYITAGISAALGAAELAVIDRQQFRAARGGVVPGTGSPVIDSVDALLAPGEMVINARSSSMFPSLLSNINVAGGGIPLAPQVPTQPQVSRSIFTKQNEVRAYVVESDITDSQRRVSRLTRNGSF